MRILADENCPSDLVNALRERGIILCRLSNFPPSRVVTIVISALENGSEWSGLFTIIHEQRIRTVPLPSLR